MYANNQTFTSSNLTWVSGGSPNVNLQYGVDGFVLGQGTMVTNSTATTYNATGLSGGTIYAAYVQDTCLGSGSSLWYGPINFTTQQCAGPNNLSASNITGSSADLSWNGVQGSSWEMQWGPAGFTFGVGILENNITTYASENNLSNATVKISDGRLKFTNSKIPEPLTFKYLERTLGEVIKNESQVNLIMEHLKQKRTIKIIPEIKRFSNS
jgi:hypothetical protein